MRRIEIILESSVEDEIVEHFDRQKITHYTRLQDAHGKGNKEPKMGDSVWPQTNAVFIVFANDDEAKKIALIIKKIKEAHPLAGVVGFISESGWQSLAEYTAL